MKIDPIRLHPVERPYLTMEEISKLITSIKNETIKVAVTTLAYTGLRVNELCSLKQYEVDLATKLIYVNCGKGNKSRVVPITERLHMVLEDYLQYENKRKPSEYFFSTNRYHTISPDYINKCIRFASEDIGLPFKPTAHILRHSFASALVSRNASLPSVQKILGHADLRITSRYIHQDIDALKEAVNLLP